KSNVFLASGIGISIVHWKHPFSCWDKTVGPNKRCHNCRAFFLCLFSSVFKTYSCKSLVRFTALRVLPSATFLECSGAHPNMERINFKLAATSRPFAQLTVFQCFPFNKPNV